MIDEYKALVNAYARSGGNAAALDTPGTASLLIHENRILSSNLVPGLELNVEETNEGVNAQLVILKGHRIKHPIHLCFGVLPEEGVQEIIFSITVEAGSSAELLAHCTFPNAFRVKHIMKADIEIRDGAYLAYNETHYHGPHGGVEVIPKARIKIDDRGRLVTRFTLTEGRVGRLDMDYDVNVGADAVAEMTAKVYGRGQDEILIRERTVLSGRGARSVIKSRVAVRDQAKSMVESITEGRGAYCRGHVDCVEIVQGDAVAEAVPRVSVFNEHAKVTHEAAIGSVDKKQVETLISRGLDESEAVDVIVMGLLK
ncbi:MAG: SufD family Fe-S cluster assembly protein [ANME-2 cluster archaeon]|nr:SufD family Fe-S cluster assembly protein [ANME-2 cluster archaeon]